MEVGEVEITSSLHWHTSSTDVNILKITNYGEMCIIILKVVEFEEEEI